MNRNFHFPSLTIILCSLIAGCGGKQQQGQNFNAPVPVNIYVINEQEVTGTDTYPGTVVPLKEVELRAQVAGYITDIYVQDGEKVKKGQLLYEIDRSKYQAGYKQAEANLMSSRANLERAGQDLERYENLAKREAIARQQVDHARAAFQSAKAQVESAEAQLSSAATDLSYSVIKAPFSGTIGISQVRLGSQVSPGQTLLNTISSDDPIAVDFVINEKEIPRFSRIQQNAKKTDSTFRINFSDGTNYPYPAQITTIDRAVDRQTGSITIRLSLPNPNRTLIAGMTVNVNVENKDIGEQLVMPFKAAVEQMGEYYVYKVQADSVVQQKVELGSKEKDLIVVREGLQKGDTIVMEGVQKLRHGAKVQLGSAPAANTNNIKN